MAKSPKQHRNADLAKSKRNSDPKLITVPPKWSNRNSHFTHPYWPCHPDANSILLKQVLFSWLSQGVRLRGQRKLLRVHPQDQLNKLQCRCQSLVVYCPGPPQVVEESAVEISVLWNFITTAGEGKASVAETACHRPNQESSATNPIWKHMIELL